MKKRIYIGLGFVLGVVTTLGIQQLNRPRTADKAQEPIVEEQIDTEIEEVDIEELPALSFSEEELNAAKDYLNRIDGKKSYLNRKLKQHINKLTAMADIKDVKQVLEQLQNHKASYHPNGLEKELYEKVVYQVEQGESLSEIVNKEQFDWAYLLKENKGQLIATGAMREGREIYDFRRSNKGQLPKLIAYRKQN